MSAQPTGSWRDRAQLIIAAALLVTVILGALTVVFALKLSHDSHRTVDPSALQASATTALTEGGQLAVDFTSFDYRTLSKDRNETASHLTPSFAKIYLTQSGVTAPDIAKVKAVSTSKVVATGLQAFSPAKHTATVIVALDDTASNVKSPKGTLQYYRLQVQLVEQNGHWLASNVELE
jgi:Mce-associated membrane protein